MKRIFYFSFFCALLLASTLNAQELAVYDLQLIEKSPKGCIGFISLSDKYILNEHPDSLAIPDLGDKRFEEAQYLTLKSTYRKRFLSATKTAETDKVFIYDYAADVLVSLAVKDLDVVACLNPYADADDSPFSQEDYMIGFAVNRKFLKGLGAYFMTTVVVVGKENPFVQGQLKPVTWKKISAKDFPSGVFPFRPTPEMQAYVTGNVYKYETEGWQYFIQDLLSNNKIVARRLLVIDSKTKKAVCKKLYDEGEGTSLAPLHFVNNKDEGRQWTGKLFKNKPAVIFGFQYHSFGCPSITFLQPSVNDLYINCDNRH